MSTATPPRQTRSLDQDHGRIRHPLGRLRKYIQGYVALEGVALLALFFALWFWVGVALDYGFFRLFGFDGVLEFPRLSWALRLGVLIVLVLLFCAVVVFRVVMRLMTEFSPATLALVLEKRFPRLLGDRLITAVEMVDPREAARLGFSADMVRETIHEAADRVDRIPVGEVLDWRRLMWRGVLVGVLTLGLWVLAGACFATYRQFTHQPPVLAGYGDVNDAAVIWFERNILLRNTIWPRRAHLELLPWGYNDDGEPIYEVRLPRGGESPQLRVRAWKYVIADRKEQYGWRPLRWADVQRRPTLAGGVAAPDLPEDWELAARERREEKENGSFTVDEVELKLEAMPLRTTLADGSLLPAKWCVPDGEGDWRPLRWNDLTASRLGVDVPGLPAVWEPRRGGSGTVPVKDTTLSAEEVEGLAEQPDARRTPELAKIKAVLARVRLLVEMRQTLDGIDARCADRAMRRRLRKLILPSTVTLAFTHQRKLNKSNLTPGADNEYTGSFGQLQETVQFVVSAEDFRTPSQWIEIVDRPRVERIESQREQPAYLYYRPLGDVTVNDLRGKLQPVDAVVESTAGAATTIPVPRGTALTLTVTVTKPLLSVRIPEHGAEHLHVSKPEQIDEHRFEVRVAPVRREQAFTVQFTDNDKVKEERKIVVTPQEDVPPRVRDFNPDEVIRRSKEGYLISANARIPFKGRVSDDKGLARVRYAVRVTPADFLSESKLQALDGVAIVPMLAPGLGTLWQAAAFRILVEPKEEKREPEQFVEVPEFGQRLKGMARDGRREVLSLATVRELMGKRQPSRFRETFNLFTLSPDKWMENDEETNPSRWMSADNQKARIDCDLPLWQLRWRDRDGREHVLKETDPAKPQRRYLVEVRLIAEDTFLEGELDALKRPIPHSAASGETFTFVVLPENELLSKIAEEEETKYRDMVKAQRPIAENLDRMRDVKFSLTSTSGVTATDLNTFIARCESLGDVLKTSQAEVKMVHAAYDRILREMRTNQLRSDILVKVHREIFTPLTATGPLFEGTIEEVAGLRRSLANASDPVDARRKAALPRATAAHKQLNDLNAKLDQVLRAMEGLTKINELIAALAEMEKREEDLQSIVARVRQIRIKELLGDDEKDKKK